MVGVFYLRDFLDLLYIYKHHDTSNLDYIDY